MKKIARFEKNDAQPGQAFWIETIQLAAAGTITAVSGQSSLILERIG